MSQQQIHLALRTVLGANNIPYSEVYDTITGRTVHGVIAVQYSQDVNGGPPEMQLKVAISGVGLGTTPSVTQSGPDDRSRVIDLDRQGAS